MQIYAGTSGYSYKEWKGSFYPEKLPASKMLASYAGRLPAVEINNTFYRLPKTSVLETWRSQVPDTFRFAVKASRRITHIKRLNEVADETAYLLDVLQTLGEQLGVILFQLPPYQRLDLPRLEAFLALLPPDTPAVFEFRHASWFDDAVYARLAERACALCVADTGESEGPLLIRTAPFAYLRLRREGYTDAELSRWLERLAAEPWSTAYVFFKHEDEAAGPRMAMRFLELSGLG